MRSFIDIEKGQVHIRTYEPEEKNSKNNPLIMFHGSPGSSKMLERVAMLLAKNRIVICPDTMGQGDSSAPESEDVDMKYFANIAIKVIKKLNYSKVDLYGTHTGSRIATEFAIAEPLMVEHVILDGMSASVSKQRLDYAKTINKSNLIDYSGSQFNSVWHTLRDGYLFWPFNKRVAEKVRLVGLPKASQFNDHFIEILKGIRSSHMAYIAALTYDARDRLPLLLPKVLVTCAYHDVPYENLDSVAELISHCIKKPHPQKMQESMCTPEERSELVEMFEDFLNS